MNRCDCDVLVSGAGPAGATLALGLARAGRSVVLVDASARPQYADGAPFALRATTFNIASQRVLESLDAWTGVESRRACRFDRMVVWDAGGAGRITFDAAECGNTHLGHVIENNVVQLALLDALQGHENAEYLPGVALVQFQTAADGVSCELADGRRVRARLLVGADGPGSPVRERAGFGVSASDYVQRAIVCNVRTERDHEATAWQRFLDTGPVAFLPLAPGYCSIVWSVRNEEAARLLALDDRAFAERLGAALERHLGDVELVGERAAFVLKRQHAHRYVAERVALIGDAAHTIHPLAGQGANLGILDAATLAECLLERRGDPGALAALRAYERWRRGENQIMMSAMDGFHHLFATPAYGVRWLRNAGLAFADLALPLKNELARRAMGVTGDLPRLARGGG